MPTLNDSQLSNSQLNDAHANDSLLNEALFEEAQTVIPGGVNSPVRAFKGVGGTPVFVDRAEGAFLQDAAGKRYIDYVMSWGPMVLGHAHPKVISAVQQAATKGLSFGAPTTLETQLAKLLAKQVPGIEQVRMVSSGTEATMSAVRLARGITGRDKIIKFEGCYHGHVDSLLVKAGSGALTLGVPTSPGILPSAAEHTLTLTYNDAEAVKACFEKHGADIACIIVEPVAGNMNLVLPTPEFLQTLRHCCTEHDSLLIFDEVMTGFRVDLQCAQGLFDVTPDLTTLGKVIGGGMPMGAIGGSAKLMEHFAPNGPVYQAGTLSGNPIATTAGLTTLTELCQPGVFDSIVSATTQLLEGLQAAANKNGIPFTTQQAGTMFGLFFTEQTSINSFSDVMGCDLNRFKQFFHGMLEAGIYMAPSAYEAGFMSLAHSPDIIETTLIAAEQVFSTLL